MPASSLLPDDVVETQSIYLSVGLGKHGSTFTFDLDGIEPEAAIGYLHVTIDRLREQVQDEWDAAEFGEPITLDMDCPECGEHIHIDFGDEDDPEEAA